MKVIVTARFERTHHKQEVCWYCETIRDEDLDSWVKGKKAEMELVFSDQSKTPVDVHIVSVTQYQPMSKLISAVVTLRVKKSQEQPVDRVEMVTGRSNAAVVQKINNLVEEVRYSKEIGGAVVEIVNIKFV